MKPRQLTKTDDPGLKAWSRFISGCPLIVGQEITVDIAATTSTVFAHKLGKTPNGWTITDNDTQGAILNREDWDSNSITLYSNLAATYKVWVF